MEGVLIAGLMVLGAFIVLYVVDRLIPVRRGHKRAH